MPEPVSAMNTSPLVLDLRPVIEMTDEQFYLLCQVNRDLRLELAEIWEPGL